MIGYKVNKDINYLAALFETNKIKPVIDKYFPLEKTKEASRYFGEGRFKGKIIVTMQTLYHVDHIVNIIVKDGEFTFV